MRVSEENSLKIKNMSLLCAALVVTCHIALPDGRESSTWLVNQLVVDGVAKMAVPFFFVVSGCFLAGHFGENGWWRREIHKRIFSLVIPYFAWISLWLFMSLGLSLVADLVAQRPFGTSMMSFSWSNLVKLVGVDLTDYPALVPLWFVRCLLLFVVVSPLISLILKRIGCSWLVICFVASLLRDLISNEEINDFLGCGFSLSGLFYFSFGCFLFQHRQFKCSRSVAVGAILMATLLLISKTVFFYKDWGFLALQKRVTVPFLMYAVWFFIPTWRLPTWLTSCSFPIFLMHMLFFPCIGIVFNRFQLGGGGLSAINWSVGFFGSIVVACLLRQVSPKMAGVLFGGR